MSVIFFISVLPLFDSATIPSVAWFEKRALLDHPALVEGTHASHVVTNYMGQIRAHLSSVVGILDTSQFHLDSVVFPLESTGIMLKSLQEHAQEINPLEDGSSTDISFEEYEYLIGLSSRIGLPSISSEWHQSASLELLSRQFRENFNVLYVDNIFDPKTLHKILLEVNRLWSSHDIECNCNLDGVNRMGGYVHFTQELTSDTQRNSLYSLIYGNESLRLWMSAVTGGSLFPADFPIELREYGENSKGMMCHADVQMYADATKSFEIVVTLSNHGECEVYWYDHHNVRHSVWPAPNSITIVQPNSAVHCVTDTRGGHREILKFIMVGDHRKHENFLRYAENRCSSTNPNRLMIAKRQQEREAASSSLQEL